MYKIPKIVNNVHKIEIELLYFYRERSNLSSYDWCNNSRSWLSILHIRRN